ncbi:MAG: hypothetical protein CVU77_04500 [Elusimicrobia bacterium HGW-Elusimicrobia-1]|jgi:hypothetical protein|nr:MAG: hypothetical protein CVU77_04500 [Elusimicrobia bacterium HGW-Elusimicrobia-1]
MVRPVQIDSVILQKNAGNGKCRRRNISIAAGTSQDIAAHNRTGFGFSATAERFVFFYFIERYGAENENILRMRLLLIIFRAAQISTL